MFGGFPSAGPLNSFVQPALEASSKSFREFLASLSRLFYWNDKLPIKIGVVVAIAFLAYILERRFSLFSNFFRYVGNKISAKRSGKKSPPSPTGSTSRV